MRSTLHDLYAPEAHVTGQKRVDGLPESYLKLENGHKGK